MTDATEQPRRESQCPRCGADATTESLARHSLSDVGYLHDDQMFQCSACGHSYSHGVPVGDFDGDATDLWCQVCNLGFMRVHRVEKQDGGVRLHLKCPHHHEFGCRLCGRTIPADGVAVTRSGAHTCPHCDSALDRGEIPYCCYFEFTHRETDGSGIALTGYPDTTGNTRDASAAYGYPEGERP